MVFVYGWFAVLMLFFLYLYCCGGEGNQFTFSDMAACFGVMATNIGGLRCEIDISLIDR